MKLLFLASTLKGLRVYLIGTALFVLLFIWANLSGTRLLSIFDSDTEKFTPGGAQHQSHYYHK